MEWIPCSERLPDIKPEGYYKDDECELYESEPVLVWGKYTREEFDYSKKECEYGLATLILDKTDGSKEWSGFVGLDMVAALGCEIIAWCPLPKPYAPDDSEGKEWKLKDDNRNLANG